jgi:hypothetical protein
MHLGLSGDSVLFIGNKVIKTCYTNQERFLRNIEKQRSFTNPFISAVPILEQGIIDGYHNYIVMPYLACDNALLWLSKANATSIIVFINRIANYLSHLRDKRNIKSFDYVAWQSKIEMLKTQLTDPIINGILDHLYEIRFTNGLYYGNYHGDLTLTNLLIFNDGTNLSIDAIDFLDCFIHTPLWDICKIRQDTSIHFTLHLMKEHPFDTNKVRIALKHIDNKIASIIDSDPILSEYYLPFQTLNLIRILPYNHDPNITAYLQDEIRALFAKLER